MPETATTLPAERPARFDAPTLAALRHNPPRLGAWAMAVRAEQFGRATTLWPTPSELGAPEGPCALLRGGALIELDALPEPAALREGDRLLVAVEPEDGERAAAYLDWLTRLASTTTELPRGCALAPYSRRPGGTHRLWLVAVARLALPATIRVEARHDLLGIRLAQIALGFGADCLSGPLDQDRSLPVAGVTRPDEATLTGLRNLIEQAGLDCVVVEPAA